MKGSPWSDIVKMQRELYHRNQKFIEESVRVDEPYFKRYLNAYKQATKQYDSLSNHDEMLEGVFNSDIIVVGDYHTCAQSQRSFLRILENCDDSVINFQITDLSFIIKKKNMIRFLKIIAKADRKTRSFCERRYEHGKDTIYFAGRYGRDLDRRPRTLR